MNQADTTAPKPERRTAQRPIYWTAPLLALFFAVAWSSAARFLLLQAQAEDDVEELNAVAALHRAERAAIAERLAAESDLLTNDPALRSLLRTPGIDRATLDDYLGGVVKHLRLSVAAIVTPEGRVVAVVGDETLGDAQLAESSILRRALEAKGAVTGVWGSQRKLLQVAAGPVRFGEVIEAIVILGAPIELEREWAAGALSLGDVMIVSWPDEMRSALDAARKLPPAAATRLTHDGALFLARTDPIDGAVLPASLTFVRRVGGDRFALILWLLWLPPLAILAWGTARIAKSWRRR